MKTKRPKWAKPLDKKQWQHLKECQERSTPSLSQFRKDREHQALTGFNCTECQCIETTLFLAKETPCLPC